MFLEENYAQKNQKVGKEERKASTKWFDNWNTVAILMGDRVK